MRRTTWVGVVGAVLVAPWLVAVPAVPASAVEPTCAGQLATIVGTDGSDRLTGTDGPDVVSLGAGLDNFDGLGGDDIICGGVDPDLLIGGGGRNRMFGQAGWDHVFTSGEDRVVGGRGNDEMTVDLDGQAAGETGDLLGGSGSDAVAFVGSAGTPGLVVDVPEGTVSGGGSFNIDGIENWDSLTAEHDVFRGGPADETVPGGPGADLLSMGSGADVVVGRGGGATLRMGRGADTVAGVQRPHRRVWLGPGDDTASFLPGTHLFAGTGNDHVTLFGPDGRTRAFEVRGAQGRDFLDFELAQNPIRLGAGAGEVRLSGTVHRFAGFERYRGSVHADTLIGSSGRDWIDGWDARDVIRGRAGNDVLIGGKGPDVIRGGGGRDVCDRGNSRGCERLR